MQKEQRTYLIKKLLYKSNYRGCKETDLTLGGFANKYLDSLTDQELTEFETILNQMDTDIWDWINNKIPLPSNISKPLMDRISNMVL